jgi:hypothetical protein
VIRGDIFDLILLKEDAESVFEGVKRKFDFSRILSPIDENYMFILRNTVTGSELGS